MHREAVPHGMRPTSLAIPARHDHAAAVLLPAANGYCPLGLPCPQWLQRLLPPDSKDIEDVDDHEDQGCLEKNFAVGIIFSRQGGA